MPARRSPGTLSLLPTLRFPLATTLSPGTSSASSPPGGPPLWAPDEGLWSLGHHEENWGPAFNMTVLAMNLSAARNAVSKLHREVSRNVGLPLPGRGGAHNLRHQRRPHLELASPRDGGPPRGPRRRTGLARRSNDRRPGRSSTRSHRASSGRPTVLQNTRWSSSSTTAYVERPGARL